MRNSRGNGKEERRPEEGSYFISPSTHSSTMNLGTEGYSRKFISSRSHIPEYLNVNIHGGENLKFHSVCSWTVPPRQGGRVYHASSTNHGNIEMFLRALTVAWCVLFSSEWRSTRIPLSYDCHSCSHFQPIFYTRLGRKRKETRSRWRYVTECNHHFPSRETSFLTACSYNSRLPREFSKAFTPREILTHAYTKASR
jgi:hypothetical protein